MLKLLSHIFFPKEEILVRIKGETFKHTLYYDSKRCALAHTLSGMYKNQKIKVIGRTVSISGVKYKVVNYHMILEGYFMEVKEDVDVVLTRKSCLE
jgi:hypothetical protein